MICEMCIADNFTEVLTSTTTSSPWYMLFFVSFTVVGTMMVVPMVIGLFQDGFQKMRERANRKQKVCIPSMCVFLLITHADASC
jgi:hypothetical protein